MLRSAFEGVRNPVEDSEVLVGIGRKSQEMCSHLYWVLDLLVGEYSQAIKIYSL